LVQPSQGRRLVGGRVKMGVFSQHALEDLNPDNDVLNEASSVAGLMPVSRLRSVLGSFLFPGDEVFKKVKVLSGGERSRLVLAKLFLQAPNFLLLDEPTNHLDIKGRNVLERALKDFTGTLVLVSHERHLINAVANKVAYVARGHVAVFPGNFDDFHRLWKKRLKPEQAEPAPTAASSPAPPAGPKTRKDAAQKRAEAEARNALYRKIKPLKDDLARVEAQLEKVTAELDALVAEMVLPEAVADGPRWTKLSKDHGKVKERLDKLTAQWEKLALALEKAQAEEINPS